MVAIWTLFILIFAFLGVCHIVIICIKSSAINIFLSIYTGFMLLIILVPTMIFMFNDGIVEREPMTQDHLETGIVYEKVYCEERAERKIRFYVLLRWNREADDSLVYRLFEFKSEPPAKFVIDKGGHELSLE